MFVKRYYIAKIPTETVQNRCLQYKHKVFGNVFNMMFIVSSGIWLTCLLYQLHHQVAVWWHQLHSQVPIQVALWRERRGRATVRWRQRIRPVAQWRQQHFQAAPLASHERRGRAVKTLYPHHPQQQHQQQHQQLRQRQTVRQTAAPSTATKHVTTGVCLRCSPKLQDESHCLVNCECTLHCVHDWISAVHISCARLFLDKCDDLHCLCHFLRIVIVYHSS